MKARMSKLMQEFLKKWIKGLRVCRQHSHTASISDRKKAIRLSADVAIASTRKASTRWSRALLSDVVSRDGNLVQQILGHKFQDKRASIACSKRILRRTRVGRRRAAKVAPSTSIARKMMRNRTRVLQKLVPGGKEMDDVALIQETLDYIVSLRVQVDVMRRVASAAERSKNILHFNFN